MKCLDNESHLIDLHIFCSSENRPKSETSRLMTFGLMRHCVEICVLCHQWQLSLFVPGINRETLYVHCNELNKCRLIKQLIKFVILTQICPRKCLC
jgi:hypothetical protein